MGKIYDIEQFVDEVEALFKSNYNAQLALVDADKNDGLILDQVNENAFVIQTMDEKAFNENPFLFIGINGVESESGQAALRETIAVEIVIVLVDNYDRSIDKKLLRYQRAMKELILSNFNKLTRDRSEVEIKSMVPIQFQLQNSDRTHKAIGIEITKTIFT
jgi:hypothetical protein